MSRFETAGRSQDRRTRFAQYAAVAVTGVVAVASLVGWLTGRLSLAGAGATYVPMAPATALTFLVLCAVLTFRVVFESDRGHAAVLAASSLVAAAMTLELLDVIVGLQVSPDRLFLTAAQRVDPTQPGRMSPVTAAAFLGLTLAVVLLESRRDSQRSLGAIVSLAVTAGALVLLVGYAYDAPLLYGGSVVPVALPTALGLLLMGIGIATLGADRWPLALLVGESIRPRLMRALVPLALVPLAAVIFTDAVTIRLGLHENPPLLAALFMTMFALTLTVVFRASARIGGESEAAAAALRRSDERLSLALTASRMGTWTWEPDASRLEWSPQAKALFGLPPEAVMDNPTFREMLYPDDRDATDRAVGEAVENLGEYDQEYRVIWPDGTLHWVHSLGRVALDESGHPVLRGVKLDVTQRKEAEKAVEESRAFLQAVIDGTPDIVYVKDVAGRYLFFNHAAELASGMSAANVIGDDDSFIYGADEAEAIAARDRRLLEVGTTMTYEEKVAMPDGTVVHSLSTKGVVFDQSGRPSGLFGIVRDISEHVESEAALLESETLLIQSQRAAAVGHYVFDIASGTWTSSEVLDELFGIGADFERSVEGWVEVVHPEDRAAMVAYLQTHVLGQHNPFDSEYRIQRLNDGAVRWVRGLGSLDLDESGAPITMFGVIQDITERKLAEIEVERVHEHLEQIVVDRTSQLEAANRELEAFSYSVSHDLRAPLRHVSGFVELLIGRERERLDEQGIHYLDVIGDSVRQMGVLIDDLLEFSRAGRAEMSLSDVDMNELVQQSLDVFTESTADLHIEWDVQDLPQVRGDRSMLRLVWTNLLGNAIKYTQRRDIAHVEVGTFEVEDEDVFFVRDDGIGFDMAYAGKLFGVFQRMHSAADFEGTGIGLANVSRVIARHGGRVWAEAEVEKGASFYFSLPKQKG